MADGDGHGGPELNEDYDLGGWTAEQRAALDLLIVRAEIPHGWAGPVLRVPADRTAEVDGLIGRVRQPRRDVIDRAVSEPPQVGQPAGPGARLLGALIDTVVVVLVSMVGLQLDAGRFGATVLVAAYEVVAVAVWGRTLGKLAVGTRVVSARDGGFPGWGSALVRWAVPAAPTLVGLAWSSSVPDLLSFPWAIAVYGGVLWDPHRQGLHDKAAGTLVVNA